MKIKSLIIIPALLLSCFFNGTKAEDTVSFVTNEWLPYMTKADKGIFTKSEIDTCPKKHGILPCVVAAAFSLEEITVEFKSYPQARAFKNANGGKLNGAVGWNRNAERERLFYYSDPLMRKERVYFHLKSFSFDWKTIGDLKGLRIGGDKTTNYSKEFMDAERKGDIKVYRVPKKNQNLKKLAYGRIDVYPMIKESGYKFINKFLKPERAKLITHHPKVMHEATWHLIFTKKKEENIRLVKVFNRGLKKLQASDKYDEYFKGK